MLRGGKFAGLLIAVASSATTPITRDFSSIICHHGTETGVALLMLALTDLVVPISQRAAMPRCGWMMMAISRYCLM